MLDPARSTSRFRTLLSKTQPARILVLILTVAVATMALGSQSSSAGSFGQVLLAKAAAMVGVSTASHALDANHAEEEPQSSSSMATERRGHTATRLQDGRVLIVGGENSTGALNGTEVFDPAAGTFAAAGNMSAARADHSATLLADGRVLIAGGRNSAGAVATTEIFDPATGTFAGGPSMSVARAGHSATLFADGQIFIAGGDATGSAELIGSSLSGTTVVGSLSGARSMHSAALMLDGRVLIAGGRDGSGNALNTGEIFGTSFSTIQGSLKLARVRPHLRVLFDGKVQIIGGNNDRSMEIYDPAEGFGAYAHVLPESDPCTGLHNHLLGAQTRAALFHTGAADELFDRSGHTITELGGQALVVGGSNGAGAVLGSSSVVSSSSAAISTDKMDYAPGQTATITGRGFQPGEVVRLKIHEDPHTPQERGFDVTADGDGNFSGEYLVMDYDLNMKFIAGARGLTSGMTAQTTFTDSNNFNVTPATQSVAAGSTNTFVWTFTATNSGNVLNTTFTIPAGWTAPQVGAGPGQVTVAGSGATPCNVSLQSVVGMVVTIRQSPPAPTTGTCAINTSFTLTYNNATAPTPATTTTYTFSNQHGTSPTVTVTADAPTKLAFTTGDHDGTYAQCLPAISIQTQNASDVPTNVTSNTTVNLATGNFGAGGSGTFYSDSGCTTAITSVVIASGNNSASFFYKATGRGDGTHDITVSASVLTSATQTQTINAASLTITANDRTKTYGDAVTFDETNPSPDFSVGALVNGDTVASITLASAGAAAGAPVSGSPYSIVPSAAIGTGLGNYSISYVNGVLTVNKASLTITASSHTITFGDAVPTITASYTGFVAGDDPTDLTVQPTCSTTYTVGSLIGTYPTKCENAVSGNYNLTYVNGTVTVLTACSAFNGFLSPIGGAVELGTGGSFADPVRAFKLNSTIPVKFNAICFGVPLTTGIHKLEAIKYSNSTTSDAPIDATPTDSATTGNQFRLTGTEWHFNLSTKGLGTGGQGKWLLRATLFDGSTYTVWVEVKK
jgi:hypothetical protein